MSFALLSTHPAIWQVKQFILTQIQSSCRTKRPMWVSNLKEEEKEGVLGLEIKL